MVPPAQGQHGPVRPGRGASDRRTLRTGYAANEPLDRTPSRGTPRGVGDAVQNTLAQSFLMLMTVHPLVAARSMALSAPDW